MDVAKDQLLDVDPKKFLNFDGPFTDIVTAHIHLTNLQDSPVCFKVKTTVPKQYCVRPSSGILKPKEKSLVAVMLQPFKYDPQEKNKHKFLIQSMIVKDETQSNLDQLWKEADPAKIMDSKLVCALRMPGELTIQPSHELVFEGPFNKPVSSTFTLTNPSNDKIFFQLQSSSSRLLAAPASGMVDAGQTQEVLVQCQQFDSMSSDKQRERILIKSFLFNEEDGKSAQETIETTQSLDTVLKCVFNNASELTTDDAIKPVRRGNVMASPLDSNVPSKEPRVDELLSELTMLRKENKLLKEADIELRRDALSRTCLSSAAGGGAAIGRQGALGAIASVPPILYLILALLVGLFLGKFTL